MGAPLVCDGHSRPVVDVAYSPMTPDGFFLISASKGSATNGGIISEGFLRWRNGLGAEVHAGSALPQESDVIAGQGTIGMEITRQAKGPLHAIFVPVGGGGLIAGVAAYVKRVALEVKIIGVEPADENAMALSLHHGEKVILDKVGGFADGVAVKEVGEETFRISRNLMGGVVLVTREAICASIKVRSVADQEHILTRGTK
ncbi:PREDICTED: threonine dehydratase biosynthetic, chloroplastic-like [Camelina sativa]|uniref:Threonine dehydratase biosynthetic, chloroplastic-like n=1 Tax=Camelina sativa TaxID=90675 RepID=A0ABM0VXX5_CAMSA|nr:PREDICTED: threonine dehydratase biosynthetic, chloroplastic-like [Camelina sativa]